MDPREQLELAARRAAREHLGLKEGDHWPSGVSEAVADALLPLVERAVREGQATAWDECLTTVTSGVESAKNAHAERGNRDIASALVGLVGAIPKTRNPYVVKR